MARARLRRRRAAQAARVRRRTRPSPDHEAGARHPLRDAPARGRLAARDRRGRRPRDLRLQVPRRRPGSAGARRRGDRQRAGPPPRPAYAAAGRPRAGAGDRTATRPTRRSRTCSTPVWASTWASTSSRAPSASTRPSRWLPRRSQARTLWLDALVANVNRGRARATRTCWSGAATSALIDHGAALYFHHAWPGGGGHRPRPLRGPAVRRQRAHPAPLTRPRRAAQDDELAARVDADGARRRCSAEVPDEWLEPRAGRRVAGRRCASGVRRRTCRARLERRRACGCPGGACGMKRLPVRRAALRARASSARSSSTSASCSTARPRTSSTSAWQRRRATRLRALDPRDVRSHARA